ncbi:uncharacterized protein LOC123871700 [Maniola jurtina]|uniref:uncharacterized protein LOC123871700 n=1 Tax=Maniola jurtina TaxID=191418 RepID=UPI001E688614|nr:uncharacterized protein LOC123871700 [Maniola jurtina]XP_045771573.1 uncharacterized protein LOC123871700 [Maniola jurtina]XP_045771574.1 uncharacterized protein LOC123871700 [Maniola jurtina]
MSYQGWFTMKDVLKDLRKATGSRVRALDEGSILVGDQPPPQPFNVPDDDAELQLARLGGSRRPSDREFIGEPDLPGIRELLKMVKNLTEEEPKTPPEEKKSLTTDVLTISKLNPNVKEFIPKSSVVNDKANHDKASSDKANHDKASSDKANHDKADDILRPIDKNELTEIKKQNLKAKICATSKETCVKVKRERNLAIASLVKLYCVPPTTDEEKPKLLVPAYFEKSNIPRKETIEKVSIEKSIDGINPTKDSPNKGPEEARLTEKIEAVEETLNPSIAESVDKVQKWLHNFENAGTITKTPKNNIKDQNIVITKINGPKEPPSTKKAPYIGAVTFKRKAPSKPISPTSTESNECVKTSKPRVYKPTKYAEELIKKYMEKKKLEEAKQQEMSDPWRLEEKIRAKEERTRKKQEQLDAQLEVSME